MGPSVLTPDRRITAVGYALAAASAPALSGTLLASLLPQDAALLSLGCRLVMTVPAPAWVNGSSSGAPSARSGHSAVWDGQQMIVWGGTIAEGTPVASGAMYRPDSDSWVAINTTDAPAARSGHTAVWTGHAMVVWGGVGDSGPLGTGGRFVPGTQTWTPVTTTDAPSARKGHCAVWTGTRMLVWGGLNNSGLLDDGALYDPVANQWTPLDVPNPPEARFGATAVWTGDRFLVWGGTGQSGELNSGGMLVFSAGVPALWSTISLTDAPSARSGHAALWTGEQMLVWGGQRSGIVLGDGAAYSPVHRCLDGAGPDRRADRAHRSRRRLDGERDAGGCRGGCGRGLVLERRLRPGRRTMARAQRRGRTVGPKAGRGRLDGRRDHGLWRAVGCPACRGAATVGPATELVPLSQAMNPSSLARLLALPFLFAGLLSAHAQWLTESFALKAGWNAVYLHVDASHDTIENLVGQDLNNPIIEIWAWVPNATTMQYVTSPQEPVDTGSQWLSWIRNSTEPSALERLPGNAAYLVRVASNVPAYTWTLKGKPLAPAYEWTTTGLNFLGFPTVPTGPPNFEDFLAPAPALAQNAEIHRYVGGDLGSANPQRLYYLSTATVNRGQACWVRAGNYYNRYFAPFELVVSAASGVDFGDHASTASLRLRNLTSSNLTVTLQLIASETPPAGQSAIAGVPPLLIRGALNMTNLTYGYTNLPVDAPRTWTLPPSGSEGAEVEVVLGLDRSALTGAAGDLLAGILRFTDSLGFAQVNVGVSATVGSPAGLWVGNAAVLQVGHYLKSYERDSADNPVTDPNGQYVVSGIDTGLGAVAHPYSLRLIVHNPESDPAVFLQRVYVGPDANTNLIVANLESALNPALLSQARRISATHLPWSSANPGWAFDSRFGPSTNLTTTVTLDFDDHASNPFLHTYHPDHDNLDARFQNALAQGAESYTVRRDIQLIVMPPADDFDSLTGSGDTLSGEYVESIRVFGLARAGGTYDTRTFEVRGGFVLRRIAETPSLTRLP